MNINEYINNALIKLKESPLKLTKQRVNMIRLLFKNGACHFTAEDVYKEVNKKKLKISLATIYNCLNQFRDNGIVKVVKVSSEKIFFDTNLKEHHHFYCQKTGNLTDIKNHHVKILKLPRLPRGKKFKSVEVVINITE